MLMLIGCGTGRVINHPYELLTEAARERFNRQYPGRLFAMNAEISEKNSGKMKINYREYINYHRTMNSVIRIESIDDGARCKVYALVELYYRQWFYRHRREDLETALLDTFEERMRSGNWPPLPWADEFGAKPKIPVRME